MILALVNNKGGIAKTTTAVNLAAALAERHKRVLLVDVDSQASASLSLGIARADLHPSAASVLLHDLPAVVAVRKTHVEGLDLMCGSPELANADLALGDMRGRERRLALALEPIRGDYDFVLVDCPPSLSLLPVNALHAADSLIIPVEPHYLALEGLANLLSFVERLDVSARLLGILLVRVDYRTRAQPEIVRMIREHYGREVFKTEVRVNTRLAEAPSFGQTIFEYDASASGAVAYRELADELLTRCRRTRQ